MRSFQQICCGLLPFLGVAIVGCGNSSDSVEDPGMGRARIVLASQGVRPATVRVTATDDATSFVVLDRSVYLTQGTSLVITEPLVATGYTIHAEASETADGRTIVGRAEARASLAVGQTKEIRLTASSDGTGVEHVSVSVDTAPVIDGIDVVLATGLDGQALITARASDPDGGGLRFFWSGLGLDGAEEGTKTLSLSAAAAAASQGAPVVHLVVQDIGGATTSANIAFDGSASCVVCGKSTSTTSAPAGGSTTAASCLETQAQCNTTCDAVSALDHGDHGDDEDDKVTCLADCGLLLAACISK